MDAAEYLAQVARDMPEKVLQERVRQLLILHGWRHYHTHRATHSPAGFPDVCAVRARDSRLLFAELKRERGRLSADQLLWINDLRSVAESLDQWEMTSVGVYIWRPSDLLDGTIEEALR